MSLRKRGLGLNRRGSVSMGEIMTMPSQIFSPWLMYARSASAAPMPSPRRKHFCTHTDTQGKGG